MEPRLQLSPLLFENGLPVDRILFDATQAFCEKEFGKKLSFKDSTKAWVVVKISEEGDGYEVVGITTLAMALDCPTFHVAQTQENNLTPGAVNAAREEARKVRDMLMTRAAAFIQDGAGPGTEVLVYVSPAQEKFWKGYLRLVGARPANRFIVKV